MKNNNSIFKFTQLFLLLLSLSFNPVGNLFGQINGWPNSSHPSEIISSDTELGKIRCRVTGSSFNSGTGEYTLNITNYEGGVFKTGDWAMMIQMQGSNMGSYTLVEIKNNANAVATSINVKPYSDNNYSNSYHSWSFGLSDRVQLVKISTYWNLTISSGKITCPAYDYDKGTGGIIPIIVGNNFVMVGGFITAAGKGFHAHFDATGGIGQGSPGSLAASSHVPSGGTPGGQSGVVNSSIYPLNSTPPRLIVKSDHFGIADGPLCLKNGLISKDLYSSGKGNPGGAPNDVVLAAGTTSGETFYWFNHSDYSTNDLHLGCSGKSGIHGAQGGGGGGFGGKGGDRNTPSFEAGLNGLQGEDGKNGGNAGMGGVGGGIIYLKVANSVLNFPDFRIRFFAQGTNGENGGRGGDGGKGGHGGPGADGTCSGNELVAPGGWGGFGGGGKGGDGADGGTGGCGGTIWILKKNGGNHSMFGNYVNNAEGKAGYGGSSGFTYKYLGESRAMNYDQQFPNLPCAADFEYCPPPGKCPPIKCDCDEVFRHLGEDMNGSVSFQDIGTDIKISKSGYAPVFWNKDDVLSYTDVKPGCSTKYTCSMKSLDRFRLFMDKILGNTNLETLNNSGGGTLDPGMNTTDFIGSKTYLYHNSHLILRYDPFFDRLYDLDNPAEPFVTPITCSATFSTEKSAYSPNGAGGGPAEAVPLPIDILEIEGNPGGNAGANGFPQVQGAFEEIGGVSAPDDSQNEDFLKQNSDNPVISTINNTVNIDNKSEKQRTFELFTLDGKFLMRKSSNEKIVIFNNLSTGYYLILINEEDNITRHKILVH